MKTKNMILGVVLLISIVAFSPCLAGSKATVSGFTDGVKYEKSLFTAYGWAADLIGGAPVKKVEVYFGDKLIGEAKLGIIRPDVAKNTGNPNWRNSGWELTKSIKLSPGVQAVHVFVLDKQGSKTKLPNERNLTVK